MGVPKLRAKAERNYRKGPAHKGCAGCKHFISNPDPDKQDGRCSVIGDKLGRQYRILPHYICDAHDDAERMAQIRRECGFE